IPADNQHSTLSLHDALPIFVRVDREPFEEDLAELEIPSKPLPGFFLLDSNLRVTDGINGGEWEDDIAANIAPVLGPFVRGAYNRSEERRVGKECRARW